MLLFFLIGALMNDLTIGHLGYLIEISPDDRCPAYSAYFNALASPAALLPLAGAALIELLSLEGVFIAAALAGMWQLGLLHRIGQTEPAAG